MLVLQGHGLRWDLNLGPQLGLEDGWRFDRRLLLRGGPGAGAEGGGLVGACLYLGGAWGGASGGAEAGAGDGSRLPCNGSVAGVGGGGFRQGCGGGARYAFWEKDD